MLYRAVRHFPSSIPSTWWKSFDAKIISGSTAPRGVPHAVPQFSFTAFCSALPLHPVVVLRCGRLIGFLFLVAGVVPKQASQVPQAGAAQPAETVVHIFLVQFRHWRDHVAHQHHGRLDDAHVIRQGLQGRQGPAPASRCQTPQRCV